nr:hypothetical protein 17 [Saccharospirillaceae bacterium]
MSLPIARVNDTTVGICCAHSNPTCIPMTGMISQGATKVMAEGVPVARLNDTVIGSCGHTGMIAGGSATVMAKGLPVARAGDSHTGSFTGSIGGGAVTTTSN